MIPYHRTTLSAQVRSSLKLLMITLLLLLIATSTFFFLNTSTTAEKGGQVLEGQVEMRELEAQNRILKQKVLEEQSIEQIESSETINGMEAAPKPIFIKPKGPLTQHGRIEG